MNDMRIKREDRESPEGKDDNKLYREVAYGVNNGQEFELSNPGGSY